MKLPQRRPLMLDGKVVGSVEVISMSMVPVDQDADPVFVAQGSSGFHPIDFSEEIVLALPAISSTATSSR